MNKSFKIPTSHCTECDRPRPSLGFVTLTSEAGDPQQHLCSECYNRQYMQRAGLPELETVYFEPAVRRDSLGKEHTFHFVVHMSTGLGIRALEWVDDGPGGYEFAVLEPPETPVREAHAKLIRKIEAGIAVRYLQSSDFSEAPSHNRLYIKGTALNGRIEERDDTPTVIVDGREYSWEELGEFLRCFTGFNFRLECFDICETREISSDPERHNPLWRLAETEPDEEGEDRRDH